MSPRHHCTDCTYPLPQPPIPLASLRVLSIDTRIMPCLPPSTAVLSVILAHLSLGLGAPLVAQLLAVHARSLTVLAFLDCILGTRNVLLPALWQVHRARPP
ncbi:hypothetical protein B0H15DRAFT_956015 [Mycena belliarum]|uniref:Uncharacterized protein n=1 Tax=Mycena belliarum TaxID=1033014 RepID=A0AAD6TQG2_9AGAR|nr:hypothetical protein B0H15DRAFT_956015 [Mycena belliae]